MRMLIPAFGNALLRKGAVKEAVAHYNEAMSLRPTIRTLVATLHGCWQHRLITSLRDGAKGRRASPAGDSLTGGREPSFFGRFAAAYAETGRFSDAIGVIQQGVAIARMQGKQV